MKNELSIVAKRLMSNGFRLTLNNAIIVQKNQNTQYPNVIDITLSTSIDMTLRNDYKKRYYVLTESAVSQYERSFYAVCRIAPQSTTKSNKETLFRTLSLGPAIWLFNQIVDLQGLLYWTSNDSTFSKWYLEDVKSEILQLTNIDVSEAIDLIGVGREEVAFFREKEKIFSTVLEIFLVSINLGVNFFVCDCTFGYVFEINHHRKIICYINLNSSLVEDFLLEGNLDLYEKIY